MSINVNISVAPAVPYINDAGLTLVIFKNARLKSGTENPVRVNTIAELKEYVVAPTKSEMVKFREVYCAEYLIKAGVNLLIYAVATPETVGSGDVTAISDLEVLQYKFLTVPYSFMSFVTPEAPATPYAAWDSALKTLIDDNDIEYLQDLTPFISTADATSLEALFSSPKMSLFVNSGFTGVASEFAVVPEVTLSASTSPAGTGAVDLDISGEFLADVDPARAYAAATDFVGIPSSLAVLARKARLLALGTPWLPVAGEQYGLIPEFTTLFRAISTTDKTAFQAAHTNVLIAKTGVGNIFVSQNTLYSDADTNELSPLYRSHVVTEALWLKRQFIRISEMMLQQPNNKKSWDTVSLKVKTLLKGVLEAEGIENYQVYVGKGVTMTESDITAGLLKFAVSYLPIRVIESVTVNVTINTASNTYDVILSGGVL